MENNEQQNMELDPQPGSSSLVKALRVVGTIALCVSAITFLVQSWHNQPDIMRYSYFLIFTLSLAVLGLICGFHWKEPKGARTFLSIFSAMMPIHFAVLGGLIYSLYGKVPPNLYQQFIWIAPDEMSLMLVVVAAVFTLVPGVIFGMRTLYRAETGTLSVFYIATNLLLLLPFRSPEYTLGVGVILLCALIILDALLQTRNVESQSFDARMVRTMLFVAPICFSIRAFGYSSEKEIFAITFFLVTAFLLIAPFSKKDSFIAFLTGSLSIGTVICGWALLGASFVKTFDIPKDFSLPFFTIPLVIYFYATAPVIRKNLEKIFFFLGSLIGVFGAIGQLWMYEGVLSSLYAISVSLGFIFYGVKNKSLGITNLGIFCLSISLIYHLKYLENIYEAMGAWLSLGLAGVLVLVTASLIERKTKGISDKVKDFYKELS